MTKKRCKWCEQGAKLIDGKHWVVRSIVPAKINIVKCVAVERPTSRVSSDERT